MGGHQDTACQTGRRQGIPDALPARGKAIASLRHPNILTVFDYGKDNSVAYIVMELVTGGNLQTRLTGQPLPWAEVAALVIPLGRALAYAHSKGIVHRDVKPANVLLAQDDWPLLGDFGLVKVMGQHAGITRPNASIGTPAYFSPEQATGGKVDHRSDIYALGILLYELLTGHVPFESESPFETMIRRLREPPTPPRRLNPGIMPQLEAMILRALAKDPKARYPTMEALVRELELVTEASEQVATYPSRSATIAGDTARLDGCFSMVGPCLVVVDTGVRFDLLHREKVLIGRYDPDMASLPDVDLEMHQGGPAGVSRHHAQLVYRDGNWLIKDLHSTNGTFLNNSLLPPGQLVPVHSGDTIRCGQLTLMFYP
jgi:serine/threonine protein kinase